MESTLNTLPDVDSQALTQGWDEYWKKKNRGGIVYALIAEFYRKVIIRPNLNHFIGKYFAKGSTLLHAGCGSGQVDMDLNKEYRLIGLDYSSSALKIYQAVQEGRCETLHSSVFDIRLPDGSVDGVYNLGVMEHFSHEEIQKSLAEFKRVLKPGGKMVLFWPPEFGVSVMFFKALRGMIKLFFRKDVKFHPDEISRLKSKKEAYEIFAQSQLRVVEYSFGPRDVWTYSIVVAEKLLS